MTALLAVPTRYDRDRYRPLRDRRMADSLRVLALDVAAQPDGRSSGSTGMAEMVVALWDRHLRHHPAHPGWADRDRVVPYRPRASALHDALLHLAGYDLSMDELRGSGRRNDRPGKRAGTRAGSEADTGPDHGLADAVGMALAEKLLADEFNREGHDIVDHRTWVFVDDDCLAGASDRDAVTLAAAWKLHKLVALYAGDGAGEAAGSTTGTPARFRRCGWNVIGPVDGHDVDAIDAALRRAVDSRDAPSLVVCRTDAGAQASRRTGSARFGGEAPGTGETPAAGEARAARERLEWRHPPFEIPRDVYESWNARERGEAACRDWQRRFSAYQRAHPALAAEFGRRMCGDLPAGFHEALIAVLARFGRSHDAIATDDASRKVLAALAPALPELLGGSAMPGGSNLIRFPGSGLPRGGTHGGHHVDYGVRASGMAAMMNGVALHGGFLPYGTAGLAERDGDDDGDATRIARRGRCRAIQVLTISDDTERVPAYPGAAAAAAPQATADLDIWQPCDPAETAVAWVGAIAWAKRPSALLLSRQARPAQPRTPEQVLEIRRGGYVLSDREGFAATLLATGTHVALAIEAQERLDAHGLPVRVVSMPSATVFARQDGTWRDAVLPPGLAHVDVAAAVNSLHSPDAASLASLVAARASARQFTPSLPA
jgi:transketolase